MSGPLADILVLDVATERAELAGRVLADLGATVVKVEAPGGARARRLPPFERGREGQPDGSLYWAAVSLGKQTIELDLAAPRGRKRFMKLASAADVLIESFDPGTMAEFGLDYPSLQPLNPGLVYVSVTPFGVDGPDAHAPATELTLEAAGGLLGLQGDGDRAPIPVGFPQAAFHAGAQAAADAIVAVLERDRSGFGQHLDVSMQAAMVATLLFATAFPSLTGADPPQTGATRTAQPRELVPGLIMPTLWPCADGYVHGVLGGPTPLAGQTLAALVRWMEEDGSLDPAVSGVEWSGWLAMLVSGKLQPKTAQSCIDSVIAFCKSKTKAEIMARARNERLLLAPLYTTKDLLNDPQLEARGYWIARGGRLFPGPFARFSRTPADPGDVSRPLSQDWKPPSPSGAAGPRHAAPHREAALNGLKVLDLSWVAVGPIITRTLAEHGATIIKVESTDHIDLFRQLPPFKDNVPGVDRSQTFANLNSSKLSVGLHLGATEGLAVARRLAIEWADVVVENFTPGTIDRLGLGYRELATARPDLVMLSTSLRGETGPERLYSGFGSQGAALAGIHAITGWPDRPPSGPWGAYTDTIAPRYGLATLAAALHERVRSGLGQHIDLSQVEASIHFIAPVVVNYTVNGVVAAPREHESVVACPHGVYQAEGNERYVAVAVETRQQWRALLDVAQLSAFANPRFASLESRLEVRADLDAALRAWMSRQEPWEVARNLRSAGVPASVALRPLDLLTDPQLGHRGFFVRLEHPILGTTVYDGLATRFSATPAYPRAAAPCLGQDTEDVLGSILGLTPDEITELAAAGGLS